MKRAKNLEAPPVLWKILKDFEGHSKLSWGSWNEENEENDSQNRNLNGSHLKRPRYFLFKSHFMSRLYVWLSLPGWRPRGRYTRPRPWNRCTAETGVRIRGNEGDILFVINLLDSCCCCSDKLLSLCQIKLRIFTFLGCILCLLVRRQHRPLWMLQSELSRHSSPATTIAFC